MDKSNIGAAYGLEARSYRWNCCQCPSCCFRVRKCPDTASTLLGLGLHTQHRYLLMSVFTYEHLLCYFNTNHCQVILDSSRKKNKHPTIQAKLRSIQYPEQQITPHKANDLVDQEMATVASPDIRVTAASPDSNRAVFEQSIALSGAGKTDEGSSNRGEEPERDSQEVGRETIREPLMYNDVCPSFLSCIFRYLSIEVITDMLATKIARHPCVGPEGRYGCHRCYATRESFIRPLCQRRSRCNAFTLGRY